MDVAKKKKIDMQEGLIVIYPIRTTYNVLK